MSVEITHISDGAVTFRITGLLKFTEFAGAQERAAEIIRRQGKVRFLVLVENFAGTEKTGDWGDISFQADNDQFIEKIAIVGDQQWKDLALLFTGKGIRRIPIEFFPTTDLARAQAWLTSDPS